MRQQDRRRQGDRQPPPSLRFKEAASEEVRLTTQAENVARILALGRRKLSSSQLRRFFHEIRRLEGLVGETPEEFTRARPLIKMVHSKAAYASRDSDFPDEFYDFLSQNIEDIENRQDFEDFIRYFEAVVGYFYGYSDGALGRRSRR